MRRFRANRDKERSRETVLQAFPVLARHAATIELSIHARLYRTVPADTLRGKLLHKLADRLGFPLDEKTLPVFQQRIQPFIAESLSRAPLVAVIGDREYELGKTGRDGHLRTVLSIEARTIDIGDIRLELRSADVSVADIPVIGIPHRGLSVISDVDDTIKISNVHETCELLAGTFLGHYRAVPGMAEVYRRWETAGIRFHYVSATPWQLYGPLSRFLESSGYPSATFHLKQFRLKDRSAVNMLRPSHQVKRRTLADLVSQFPARRFVLVGDSTEGDPIIYAELQRLFPGRISQVLIRNTGHEKSLVRALRELSRTERTRWQVFGSPGEIDESFLKAPVRSS